MNNKLREFMEMFIFLKNRKNGYIFIRQRNINVKEDFSSKIKLYDILRGINKKM